jgi:ABC-type multidrug transport system ATPase subunit
MPGPESRIQVHNLGKRFNREWIFRNFNYTFNQGKTYAITGPNGSGKSTLLQLLWGQVPPSKGTIHYFMEGKVIEIEAIYQHIAIATPYMDLVDEFTLEELLKFHFHIKQARSSLSVETIMERMYLTDARNKYISQFSSGMRQRLKLGLAFFTKADLIFLDEPSSNLDEKAFAWYLDLLNNNHHNATILIASNQPSEYPSNTVKIDLLDYK